MLSSLPFNVFPNILFLFVTKIYLLNYASDNNLCRSFPDVSSRMKLRSQDSNITINWLILNHMIISPKKFQTIVIARYNSQNKPTTLSISNMTIKIEALSNFFE